MINLPLYYTDVMLTLIPRTVADFQHPCRNKRNNVLYIFDMILLARDFSGKKHFYHYMEVKI